MENTSPHALSDDPNEKHLGSLSVELTENLKKIIMVILLVEFAVIAGAFVWFYSLKLITTYLITKNINPYSLFILLFALHAVILIFFLFVINKKINAITFPLVASALSKLHYVGALQKKTAFFSSLCSKGGAMLGASYALLKLIGKKKTLRQGRNAHSPSLLALGVKEVLLGSLINKLMTGFFTSKKKFPTNKQEET